MLIGDQYKTEKTTYGELESTGNGIASITDLANSNGVPGGPQDDVNFIINKVPLYNTQLKIVLSSTVTGLQP